MSVFDRSYHGFNKSNVLLDELHIFLQDKIHAWCSRKEFIDHLVDQPIKGSKKRKKNAKYWRDAVRRANTQGLFEVRKTGNDFLIRISEKGKRRILVSRIRNVQECYPQGGVCLVTFDIPEDQRIARRVFRSFIKQCGFQQFQKSVWICDRRVGRHLLKFVDDMRLRQWVRIIEGNIL